MAVRTKSQVLPEIMRYSLIALDIPDSFRFRFKWQESVYKDPWQSSSLPSSFLSFLPRLENNRRDQLIRHDERAIVSRGSNDYYLCDSLIRSFLRLLIHASGETLLVRDRRTIWHESRTTRQRVVSQT